VDFLSSGITRKNMSTSRFLYTFRPLWSVSSTPNRHDPSMHPVNGHNQPTVKSSNWHQSMRPPSSKRLEFTLFNHVLGLSSTMHALSMQQCSQLLMKSAVPKPRPNKKRRMPARCYSTMLQLTLWPLSDTMPATWLSIPTRMQQPTIVFSPMHEVTMPVTIS
jgi:hypothetical protein